MDKYPEYPILLVDDEVHTLLGLTTLFKSVGLSNTIQCEDPFAVLNIIKENHAKIVILDLIMPKKSGEELLAEIIHEFPDVTVIVVTARHEVSIAVNCMKKGAYDYYVKPIDNKKLLNSVLRAVEIYDLRKENILLKNCVIEGNIPNPEAFSQIVSGNRKMFALFQYCNAIATSRQPILITGETGAGKELFAQSIHQLSGVKGKFIAVNLAGLDSNMVSDTLFGHVKGAFTGADSNRNGMLEIARDGSLFIDEIGDLNDDIQIKLLRVLQEREYTPLGSDSTNITNAKIIAATHQDLKQLVNENRFRKDLYYRLRIHHIHIPPLRERLDDIELLLNHFIKNAAAEFNKKVPSYPRELITLLKTYHFPGNIRELRSMIYDVVSGHKTMMLSMKPFQLRIENEYEEQEVDLQNTKETANQITFPSQLPFLKDAANLLIIEAMKRAEGNQHIAAKLLGISRQALSKRLKKINTDREK